MLPISCEKEGLWTRAGSNRESSLHSSAWGIRSPVIHPWEKGTYTFLECAYAHSSRMHSMLDSPEGLLSVKEEAL